MITRALPVVFALALVCARAEDSPALAALEAKHGGRLGVEAIDTGSGQRFGHREGERFAMCSTFKLLLGAAILARVDAGKESLERMLPYTEADLLSYAPVTRENVVKGEMSVGDLCKATIQTSDNTAANLLLATVGGPEGLTDWLRGIGDSVTRLDRIEPELNTNLPDDPRDTTTPEAMAATMRKLLVGDVLSEASRNQLNEWLIGTTTGDRRIRAGVGKLAAKVGDKTGTGERGAANDVAIVWPEPDAAPWVIAVFYSVPDAEPAEREEVIAEAARVVAEEFLAGAREPK